MKFARQRKLCLQMYRRIFHTCFSFCRMIFGRLLTTSWTWISEKWCSRGMIRCCSNYCFPQYLYCSYNLFIHFFCLVFPSKNNPYIYCSWIWFVHLFDRVFVFHKINRTFTVRIFDLYLFLYRFPFRTGRTYSFTTYLFLYCSHI